nr:hypothetical protein [uncultured Pseudogulbenkiania sp.]
MTNQHQPITPVPPRKREWHGTHHAWSFSPHAFRWTGEQIAGLNFLPVATEMRAWMLRRGHLSLMPPSEPPTNGGFTNPYTASGITLALLMSRVINASHDFATTSTGSDEEVDVEIERIRLCNELLIYSARLCEVAIKQLLYCTQIPVSQYQRMALGQLLESPCPSCKRKSGQEPHLVSLVGTLAHPYHLCLEFEHCAMDHMDVVNKLRNSQAAHSEVQALNIRSIAESKAQLLHDSDEILSGFVHMLSHLEDLERKMLADLAEKGETINRLKRSGLSAEDCNFNLVPGQPFVCN